MLLLVKFADRGSLNSPSPSYASECDRMNLMVFSHPVIHPTPDERLDKNLLIISVT